MFEISSLNKCIMIVSGNWNVGKERFNWLNERNRVTIHKTRQ